MRNTVGAALLLAAACARAPVEKVEPQKPTTLTGPTQEQCRADEALCEPWIGRGREEACSIQSCASSCRVEAGTDDACLACIRVVTHECEEKRAEGERACERLRRCAK